MLMGTVTTVEKALDILALEDVRRVVAEAKRTARLIAEGERKRGATTPNANFPADASQNFLAWCKGAGNFPTAGDKWGAGVLIYTATALKEYQAAWSEPASLLNTSGGE